MRQELHARLFELALSKLCLAVVSVVFVFPQCTRAVRHQLHSGLCKTTSQLRHGLSQWQTVVVGRSLCKESHDLQGRLVRQAHRAAPMGYDCSATVGLQRLLVMALKTEQATPCRAYDKKGRRSSSHGNGNRERYYASVSCRKQNAQRQGGIAQQKESVACPAPRHGPCHRMAPAAAMSLHQYVYVTYVTCRFVLVGRHDHLQPRLSCIGPTPPGSRRPPTGRRQQQQQGRLSSILEQRHGHQQHQQP